MAGFRLPKFTHMSKMEDTPAVFSKLIHKHSERELNFSWLKVHSSTTLEEVGTTIIVMQLHNYMLIAYNIMQLLL